MIIYSPRVGGLIAQVLYYIIEIEIIEGSTICSVPDPPSLVDVGGAN